MGGSKSRHNDSNRLAELAAANPSSAMGSKGNVNTLAPYIASALRNGFCDLGTRSMSELHGALQNGQLKMELRSFFGQKQAENRALTEQRSRLQYVQFPA